WPSEMSRRVTRDDIAAVIALYKANHVLREISAQTGVALRVVQNFVKHFRDLGVEESTTPLPKSGRPKLLSPRTLKVISRQVRSNPTLTAREVRERNPRLLSHVSLRCVQQALHDDLGFKSFRARRKPLLTKRQKENRPMQLYALEPKFNKTYDGHVEEVMSYIKSPNINGGDRPSTIPIVVPAWSVSSSTILYIPGMAFATLFLAFRRPSSILLEVSATVVLREVLLLHLGPP
ncbi:putative Transposase-containing protein 17, partial [Homarus americanus]